MLLVLLPQKLDVSLTWPRKLLPALWYLFFALVHQQVLIPKEYRKQTVGCTVLLNATVPVVPCSRRSNCEATINSFLRYEWTSWWFWSLRMPCLGVSSSPRVRFIALECFYRSYRQQFRMFPFGLDRQLAALCRVRWWLGYFAPFGFKHVLYSNYPVYLIQYHYLHTYRSRITE